MSISRRCQITVVLTVALAAVAGCGGSSSTTTTSTTSTPASSSAPAPSSTAPSSNSTQLAKSTPIASPAFYNFALQVATNSAPQLNTRQTAVAAHCFQKGFLAAGFKIQGDLEKPANGDKERSVTVSCILKAQNSS